MQQTQFLNTFGARGAVQHEDTPLRDDWSPSNGTHGHKSRFRVEDADAVRYLLMTFDGWGRTEWRQKSS